MNIMKKRISLVLGMIMLALVIIPVINVKATEQCQVTMTATMGDITLQNKTRYQVVGGETVKIKAASSKAGIKFIAYYFAPEQKIEQRTKIYSSETTITIPYKTPGTLLNLMVEPVATNDDGSANTVTKTGWQKYTLEYVKSKNEPVNTVNGKDVEVKYGNTVLANGATTSVEAGDKIVINAMPAANVSSIWYSWNSEERKSTTATTYEFSIPANAEDGKTYEFKVNALYSDNLFVDGKDANNTKSEVYYFKVSNGSKVIENGKLDVEPWMEENDDIEELAISLRNDSEEENKANKNIYKLNETVTYYIDYKNGGKDLDKATIVLNLPLEYDVVDFNGGSRNSDDEIEWNFANGLESGAEGTIAVKVKYTELKKSRDDANTIYPTAMICKGNKVKDVSTVINYIITEYDEELDIDHAPYMHGDADADTFRPDHVIRRAEGTLVLLRIMGVDYENTKTITTKYADINTTFEEAQKAITVATEMGLVNGFEEDGVCLFKPDSEMTKAQFMKILACMVQKNAEDEEIDGLQIKELNKLIKIYDDETRYYYANGKREDSHWAIEEVSLLARLNMLPLNEDNDEIKLDDFITRAEVAQLVNFYLLRAPAEVTTKTKTGFSDVSRNHDLAGDIIEATRETHTFSITEEVKEVKE